MRPWRQGRLPPIRPRWLAVLGILVLAGLAWLIWNQLNTSRTSRLTYQTATVSRGTLRTTIAATGPIANPSSVPASFKNAWAS